MSGFRIEGNTSGNVAEVDANNNLKVNLPTDITQAGIVAIGAINHDGSSGAARAQRAAEISVNRRLRVGLDNILFQDAFNYAALNTAVWNMALTTWTATYGVSGYTSLVGTTAAGNAVLRTWKYFPLYNGAGLSMEAEVVIAQPLQTGQVIEIGMGQALTNAAPTDGIFFRFTSGGALNGVMNYGGTESVVNLTPVPTTGISNSYLIRVEQEEASFWVNGVLLGTLSTPSTQAGPAIATYQPVLIRMYAAGATAVAQTLKIGEVRVFLRDINANRPWPIAMAGLGMAGSQLQSGAAVSGSTALMINGAGVALVATTNVATAPATVFLGLGGNVLLQPFNAANTDGWLMGYQVPAGTAVVNGKSLVITGVKISSVVGAVFTGGPLLAVYSLAYGATAGALNTAEAAGGAATTKAFRRVPLGIESFPATAAAGTMGQGVYMQFLSPIMVNQGEWFGVTVKNVGTAVTVGNVFYTVTFDSHWE
jgi:hypothetical protein